MNFKESLISYLQDLQKPENRKSVFFKELDQTIYFSPVTVLDQEKIFAQSGGGSQSKEFHLFTIIEMAQAEDGSKIFEASDRAILEKLPWRVVTRISNAIQSDYSVEAAKKNLKETPSGESFSPSPTGSDVS